MIAGWLLPRGDKLLLARLLHQGGQVGLGLNSGARGDHASVEPDPSRSPDARRESQPRRRQAIHGPPWPMTYGALPVSYALRTARSTMSWRFTASDCVSSDRGTHARVERW